MMKRWLVLRPQRRGDATEQLSSMADPSQADRHGLAAEEIPNGTAQPGSRRAQKPALGLQGRLASCHGGTTDAMRHQFQFRNLSGDPRLNLRLKGILTSQRGSG